MPILTPQSAVDADEKPRRKYKRRTAADVLDQAADYIEKHGWAKQMLRDNETGAVCMIGSLHMVAGDAITLYTDAEEALTKSLAEDGLLFLSASSRFDPVKPKTIAQVNDRVFRSRKQAVAALRRAAKRARGEKVQYWPMSKRNGS